MGVAEVSNVLWREREQLELLRAVEVDSYAQAVGLDPSPSLSDLALLSPEPWRDLLIAHRDSLVEITTAIGRVTAADRDVLATSQRAAHETLLSISGQLETYAPTGRTTAPAPSRLVDQAL